MTGFLSQADFNTVVRLAPLVSIDLIIRDSVDRVFLGLRNKEPAKNWYFVPGGIVRKHELLAEAFARIAKAEVNLRATLGEATFVGVYDHVYDTNAAEERGYGTRYVVLAYEFRIADAQNPSIDAQHREFVWWTEGELLLSERVHEYTKAYFAKR